MAIDDAEKRRAAAGLDPVGVGGVTPNASKDAEWRAQVGKTYSGNAIDAPTSGGDSNRNLLLLGVG